MQFKVPQFIDVEDKLFGPFSFKQFLYLIGGGGICFVLYELLPLMIAIILMIPVVALSLSLTFYKFNGKPFMNALESGFSYFIQTKLYVWKKRKNTTPSEPKPTEKVIATETPKNEKKLTEGKLQDIAWSLDVLDIDTKQK